MYRTLLILSIYFVSTLNIEAQNQDFTKLMIEYKKDYNNLGLPEFKINYKENLESIQVWDSVLIREAKLMKMVDKIKTIDRYSLTKNDRISFELMRYQINLTSERISLEKKWLKQKPDLIPENGVYNLHIGKAWYKYLIHQWVDLKAEPEKLFEFGKQEVDRVKAKITALKGRSGLSNDAFEKHINDDSFFYNSPKEVQAAFERKKQQLIESLKSDFPFMENLPDHSIKQFKEDTKIQTPAFYRNDEKTFYYNFFNRSFNKRQIGWIYLHEAVPGHHYQIQITKKLKRSLIQKMFNYSGYREGWAAYVEEIGYEIGAYENIYDELGKYEWDLIRSVRVVLDVGMNYYGWDNKKALAYWQEHIKNQDDIAQREIKRMRTWPAQVITYKYGADKILKWRELLEQKPNFDVKAFHKLVLENGDIPFSVLEPFILNEGLTVTNNIQYVQGKNVKNESLQRLNLIIPKNEIKPALLLWVGGGAWAFVDRHREMNFAKRIAHNGIAVASVGHRLSSAVFQDTLKTEGIKHPEHIKDIANAFCWLYENADKYGYDRNKIYVGGFSSGAHLSALLSLDNRHLNNVGLDKSNIKGVIPISGTYDILDYKEAFANGSRPQLVEQHVHAVFGETTASQVDASPITYIDDISVPMLLISDANMIGYTNVFEEKILDTEFDKVDFLYIRNMNHRELYDELENNHQSKYRDFIIDFIR